MKRTNLFNIARMWLEHEDWKYSWTNASSPWEISDVWKDDEEDCFYIDIDIFENGKIYRSGRSMPKEFVLSVWREDALKEILEQKHR